MTKPILLACCLTAFAAAACAQMLEKAAPAKAPATSMASPLVVSGKPEAGARPEPQRREDAVSCEFRAP